MHRVYLAVCVLLLIFAVVPITAWAQDAWQAGVAYSVGDLVTYGSTYECIQAHTSQVGWEPDNAAFLWSLSETPTPTSSPTSTATPASTSTPTVAPTPSPTSAITPTATVQSSYASGLEASTVITETTSSGAVWVIERRFTYGEAATVIMLMAITLVMVFDIALRLAVIRL